MFRGTPAVHSSSGLHGPSSMSPAQPELPRAFPNRTDCPLHLPQSRDRKVLGDYSGALSYGSTAKYLNITALLINIFLVILILALVATGTITAMTFYRKQEQPESIFGPT